MSAEIWQFRHNLVPKRRSWLPGCVVRMAKKVCSGYFGVDRSAPHESGYRDAMAAGDRVQS
ncbi:MAG TPA: hypothetical protein VF163_22775, partial [Micromonosporaceae bacterium]